MHMTEISEQSGVMKGTIKITAVDFRFHIDCSRDADGKEFPQTTGNFLLSGINLSGGAFNKVDIRLLNPNHIVSNPTSSEEVIRIELPKADYELMKDLLQKMFTAPAAQGQLNAPSVLLQYQSVAQTNRFNVSFLLK
jgi:hypothetical protein